MKMRGKKVISRRNMLREIPTKPKEGPMKENHYRPPKPRYHPSTTGHHAALAPLPCCRRHDPEGVIGYFELEGVAGGGGRGQKPKP